MTRARVIRTLAIVIPAAAGQAIVNAAAGRLPKRDRVHDTGKGR